MFDVPLDPDTRLTNTFDLEAIVTRSPSHYLVKGMFCNRFVAALGDDFEQLRPKLISPPRGERYLPFKDYPQADYTRIVVATAAKLFPALSLGEATRRVAREDFATFAQSTMGKVMLSLIGDPQSALLHMPEAYAHVAPGPQLRAEARGATSVRLLFSEYIGVAAYLLGQLEGIVLSYKRTPRITIHDAGGDTLAFDVDHHA